jgi:nucleoside 2-deoxyribosyltransferase
MSEKRKVYLAAPLFGLTERHTNRVLAKAIVEKRPDLEVLLPQDFKYHNKFNDAKTFGEIYRACIAGVECCDIVVALLDGADSDSGTCYEVGYARALKKPVIGVRTDYRGNQEKGVNLMLSRGCNVMIHRPAFDEDFEALARDIAKALNRLLPKPKDEEA